MRLKFLGILSLALLSLTGCSDEDAFSDKGTGKVNVSLSADSSVTPSTNVHRASEGFSAMEIAVENMSLRIARNDGKFDKTWDRFGDYDPSTEFPVGKYTVEAFYGSMSAEGFDSPYYFGSTEINVFDSQTSTPQIKAALANTMVKLNYTDAFKSYFTDYVTTIHSTGGKPVSFVKDETRAAYVRPGNIAIEMALTKTTGVTFSFSPATIENAKAKTLYNVTFDVNGGNVGDAVLSITFDETTVLEPIEIDLSDELIQAPVPEIIAKGFESGKAVEILEGDVPSAPVSVTGIAHSGLKSVVMTTQSAYLASLGWPAEVDLMSATPEQKALMESKGLDVKGLWSNPDKMFVIGFDNLLKNLKSQAGDGSHSFGVQIKDVYSKVSETLELKVLTNPIALSFEVADKLVFGQTSLSLKVKYNGKDFDKNVKFHSYNQYGAKVECAIEEVVALQAEPTSYSVRIKVPDTDGDLKIGASYKDVYSTPETVVPRRSIMISEADVYSYTADITIKVDDLALREKLVNSATVDIKTETGSYAPANIVNKDASTGKISISGLSAGTAYTAKVSTSDEVESYIEEVSFATEAALGVPNGDFEEIAQTINIKKIQQGGQWTSGMQWLQYSYADYDVSEPAGWASVNAKTCCTSAKNQNTWFVSPSTFNSAFKGVAAQNGSNAMVLRNVGWDLDGSTPGLSTNGVGAPYSKKAASVANRAAGKLFIGTYEFDSSSSSETYTEGVAFASRPVKLSGFYAYSQDSQDSQEKGVVTVTLLNGDSVIASGVAELEVAGSYTKFDVVLNYSDASKKATQLKIMISSSNHSSYTISEENAAIKTTNYMSEAEQITRGAQLTVDNLTFSYK